MTVLALGAPVTPETILDVQRQILDALRSGRRAFVIDLGVVNGIATSTLSLLCGAIRQLQHQGAALAIADPDPCVLGVLRLCRFDELELHPSVERALAGRPFHQPAQRRSVSPALEHQRAAEHPCATVELVAERAHADPVGQPRGSGPDEATSPGARSPVTRQSEL